MMFNEDPAAHVVVPRLKAAGADLGRIHILQHVKTKEDRVREFAIASDIRQLKDYLEANRSIRLVAIDPFSAYFGSNKKLNDDQTVRDVTAPLIQLAEQTGVAIVDNSHLNKTVGLDAIQKVIGAMAVVAIHRMAWVFTSAENEDDRRERMMLPLKHNITGKAEGLKFSVESVQVQLDDGLVTEQPHIFHTGMTDLSAQETVGMTVEQRTQLQDVIQILREEFIEQLPMDAEPVIQRIKREVQNCSDSLIRKARKAANVKTRKVGKKWRWFLQEPTPNQ